MKIAVLGGTFNPVHIGHLNLIKNVISAIKPDKFLLIPTHIPPHKPVSDLADDIHRLNMLKIAAKTIPTVEVDDFELNNPDKSYTVTTMEHLKTVYPDDEIFFVMGSDMLFTFLDWYKPQRIMQLCTLVAASRSKDDCEAVYGFAEKIKKMGYGCIVVECEPVEISSTEVRAGLISERTSNGFVLPEVEEYILKNNLYNFDKSKYNNYVDYLKSNLSQKRFVHSVNVANEALRLAVLNGCDRNKAYFAGLVHDICKELPPEEQLELVKRSRFRVTDVELCAPKTHHAIAGSVYLSEKFGITDEEILSAVRYHTVAKGGMNTLEKIVYMADLISAERDYKDVGYIRSCTRTDIDLGMYEAMKFTVKHSVKNMRLIPDITLDAYNEYTKKMLDKGLDG